MDTDQASLHLLSHFDQTAADTVVDTAPVSPVRPTRGILWVMKCACTAASLIYGATLLTECAYSLAAEQLLARAARAGVLEATLPRATIESVEQSVERRLTGHLTSPGELRILLLDNGACVTKKLQPRGGDRLSIALTIPAQALMPNWLRALTSWRSEAKIAAHAERTMPGRQLSRLEPAAQARE
jgi:hypothetical protein